MEKIKYLNKRKMDEIIQNDRIKAEDTLEDNNNITKMILINFVIQILKLVIIIINISYFLGFFWYILCDLQVDVLRIFERNQAYEDLPYPRPDKNVFDT